MYSNLELINDRTIFGRFRTSYWGHAFDNTEKGKIGAESMNIRPFFFVLYLSARGKLYIGCQYLGQYGGYQALCRSICRLLDKRGTSLTAHSFRVGASYYKNAIPKEIRVTLARKSSSISSDNKIIRKGYVAFRQERGDTEFAPVVSRRLLSVFDRDAGTIRRAVANLINETELLDVADEDIENCSVVASVDGRRKTLYMFDNDDFATRFPISVPLDADRHPVAAPTKKEIMALLSREIISRSEAI